MSMPQIPPPEHLRKAPSLFKANVQSLKDNASRLGLTWQMHLGIVISYDSSSGITMVVLDGDTEPIAAKSMIGPVVNTQRVYVHQVPPSGYFIAGFVGAVDTSYSARRVLSASAASVTFSSVPTGLRSLIVRWSARSDTAAAFTHFGVRPNGNAAAVYSAEHVQGNAAAVSSAFISGLSYAFCGHAAAATATAGLFGSGEIVIVGWDSPHSGNLGYSFTAQVMSSGGLTNMGGGVALITGPYSSLVFVPGGGNFVAGTDIQLEGLAS